MIVRSVLPYLAFSRRALVFNPAFLGACVIFSGCASSPKYAGPPEQVEVPQAWQSSSESSSEAFDPLAWAADFQDARLEAILEESLERNYDLQAASSRLDAALALSRSNRSELWPTLGGTGSGNNVRRSSSSGVSQTPTAETYGLNARLAWEIDLWGKLRNGARGDLADAEAAVADYQAARLSIAARTAKAWYTALEAQQQFALEQRIIEALTESSRIVEDNFSSGIAGALDVRLVRANLASTRSSLEQRRRNRDAAVRTLEVLLGRYPQSEFEVMAPLPEITTSSSAGIPSDLLLRRPDVLAAERRLAAAEQRKYESSKARLPSIDLVLSRGTSSAEVDEVFEFVERRIWTQSLAIAQTLFQGGRLKANFKRAKATYEQAVATYAQTVLQAFREVEDALSFESSFQEDQRLLQIAAEESIEAERLAWEEYGRGLTDITTALDAVRRSITAQRSLLQVTNQRIQNRIDLYLALGGGFDPQS